MAMLRVVISPCGYLPSASIHIFGGRLILESSLVLSAQLAHILLLAQTQYPSGGVVKRSTDQSYCSTTNVTQEISHSLAEEGSREASKLASFLPEAAISSG